MKTIRILFLGDIVGLPGRTVFQKHIKSLKEQYRIDAVIANGENSAANGRGIDSRIAQFFREHGVDVITTGNHIWQSRDIYSYLAENTDVLRPENYPAECPGSGVTTFYCKGIAIGVINLMGRVFMRDYLNCPFRTADTVLSYLKHKTNVIIVDFHAETTSEKIGIGFYLDGKVSAVIGTHCHVQTADERILPNGTAFITDAGMAGAYYSMLGMKKGPIIQQFLSQMPVKFVVEDEGPMMLSGVIIEVATETGKATNIERIKIIDNDIRIARTEEL
jgi:hypothetical protein